MGVGGREIKVDEIQEPTISSSFIELTIKESSSSPYALRLMPLASSAYKAIGL